MKRLKLLKVSIIENKLKTITTTHLSTVNGEVRKSTIGYLMKNTLLLIFSLLLAGNVFGYEGNICVADYYNTIERPFVIDCYGVIESIEIYETYPITDDEKEEYCELVNWEYDNICTNTVYCKSIYWEDADNCIYPDIPVDKDFCQTILFQSTRQTCLNAVKEKEKI